MATYSVTRSKHATLVATVVDTINFDSPWSAMNVMNKGNTDIYFKADYTNPTIAGDECLCIPAGEERSMSCSPPSGELNTQVRLISAGIPQYSMEAY